MLVRVVLGVLLVAGGLALAGSNGSSVAAASTARSVVPGVVPVLGLLVLALGAAAWVGGRGRRL